jgi:hypothetical protein
MGRIVLPILAALAIGKVWACPIPGESVFSHDFELGSGSYRYVAASAPNNTGDGSYAQPWKTIQFAADHVSAGDTVCVHGGTYAEFVAPTHFGSSAAGVVTLRNMPGEVPIIDGASFANVPNGQWGLLTLSNPHDIVVRGFELRNFVTGSTAQVPIGLYVTGAGGNIRLVGNHVHDIHNSGEGCAANAFGIKVDGTQAPASIHDLVISGNEVDHLVLGCSESFSLDGNVEHWRIDHNTVHDTNNIAIGAIGFETVAPQVAYDQARDGEIVDNVVYNVSSFGNPAYGNEYSADGIYVDGGTRIVIERNLIHHADIGVEVASEHTGRTSSDTTVRNNLIYLCNVPGISLGGYANGVGGTTGVDIVGNTLFHNDTTQSGTGEIQIPYHATLNRIANNLIVSSSQGVMLYSYVGGADPAVLDYNLYFSSAGSKALWTWKGSDSTGFANFKTNSSQEMHGAFADPLLANTATPDLHVLAGSPAIDHGTDLGVAVRGSLDAQGAARVQGLGIDIGAYER